MSNTATTKKRPARLKLVNNTWVAFAAEAAASSVALARRLGLDTEEGHGSPRGQPARVGLAGGQAATHRQGNLSAQFALSLAFKDVRLALQAAGDDRFAALACLADEW